jgi:hypothetical protein
MPKITRNKVTSSVIFNRRGVQDSGNYFAYVATQNFSVLKSIARYEANNSQGQGNRSNLNLFNK